jgi:3-oxoacyl-[acyl-carrier-protein] synthase-3
MIGIKAYSYVLGREIKSVEEIVGLDRSAESENMRKIGLDCVPTDNKRLLSDMIMEAYGKLENDIDCVLVAHSLPFVRVDEEKTDMEFPVPVYYVSGLPCAIMHRAVEMAGKLIQNNKYSNILVIGADKAYSDEERTFFGTIMGDAVIALVVSRETNHNQILSSCITTSIYAPEGENSNLDDISEFRSKNAWMMRRAILMCMEKAGVEKVDYFVTHTSNRSFWDGVAALLHYPRDVFLDDNICNTGHMNSHDSFYHFLYFMENVRFRQGERVMLINPGFGGTQGCTLIEC